MVVAPMIKAVLSGGGKSEDDADAVDTGVTGVITTSTATPMDTLIRVAACRDFLTRSWIGLEPNICGSPPERAATTARTIRRFRAVPASAHQRTVSQDRSRRTGNLQTGASK